MSKTSSSFSPFTEKEARAPGWQCFCVFFVFFPFLFSVGGLSRVGVGCVWGGGGVGGGGGGSIRKLQRLDRDYE